MKNRLFYGLALIATLTFLSCEKNEDTLPTLAFEEIARGALYGVGEEGIEESNLVITTQNELDELIVKMNEVNDAIDEITIDFESYMVIGIFLEVKHNGHKVEIDEICEKDNSILVSRKETELASRVFTQPYHLVKIPKTGKEILFE